MVNVIGCIVLNFWIRKKHVSPFMLIGGILLAIGLFLIPVAILNKLFWIVFLLDYTWPMLIYYLVFLAPKEFKSE